MHKKTILISEPFLTAYRIPIWNGLAKKNRLILLCDKDKLYSPGKVPLNSKIKFIKTSTINFFGLNYQLKLIDVLKNVKNLNAITLSADIKSISNYLAMFFCKKESIPVYIWGHGLFKKNLNNFFLFILFKLILNFQSKYVTKYICYNDLVKKSLKKINFPNKKLITIILFGTIMVE